MGRLVAFQQRGGRGGQGGANFGPQGGGQGRGGQGQGGGANFGPGAGQGRGNGGGGPGGPGGPGGGPGAGGGPGGRGGQGGGRPGKVGSQVVVVVAVVKREAKNGQGERGEGGRGDRGERGGRDGRGNGGGGPGAVGQAGGQQQNPPQPWSSAALSSFDLTQQGGVQLNQLLDLVDATIVVDQNGTQTTYTSPFTSLPLDVANYSPTIMDKLTTVESQTIPGRINIMECPREILLGLPGMTQGDW